MCNGQNQNYVATNNFFIKLYTDYLQRSNLWIHVIVYLSN
jgi:hypothetical protein